MARERKAGRISIEQFPVAFELRKITPGQAERILAAEA